MASDLITTNETTQTEGATMTDKKKPEPKAAEPKEQPKKTSTSAYVTDGTPEAAKDSEPSKEMEPEPVSEETLKARVEHFCSIANKHLADLGCHDMAAKSVIRAIAKTLLTFRDD